MLFFYSCVLLNLFKTRTKHNMPYFFVATITGHIRYLKTIYYDTTLQINVCRLTTMFYPLALEDIHHKDGISNLRSLRGTMNWVLGRGMTPTFCWQKKDYQILQLPTPEQGIYVQTTEISFPSVCIKVYAIMVYMGSLLWL